MKKNPVERYTGLSAQDRAGTGPHQGLQEVCTYLLTRTVVQCTVQ